MTTTSKQHSAPQELKEQTAEQSGHSGTFPRLKAKRGSPAQLLGKQDGYATCTENKTSACSTGISSSQQEDIQTP